MPAMTVNISESSYSILCYQAQSLGTTPEALFELVVVPQAESSIRSWEQQYKMKRLEELESIIAGVGGLDPQAPTSQILAAIEIIKPGSTSEFSVFVNPVISENVPK